MGEKYVEIENDKYPPYGYYHIVKVYSDAPGDSWTYCHVSGDLPQDTVAAIAQLVADGLGLPLKSREVPTLGYGKSG